MKPSMPAMLNPAEQRELKFRSAGMTDQGRVRTLNEDAFLDMPAEGLWAVADGMGGHQCGDFASALIVSRLSQIRQIASVQSQRAEVIRVLRQANEELRREARQKAMGSIGATVAVLTAYQGYYSCIWAGDSRIYLLRERRLYRITNDHSLVQTLVDAGEITPAEARRHAQAHVVTRAVGAATELYPETSHGEVKAGDRFLLCTDGLTSVLEDNQILENCAPDDIQSALGSLIGMTLLKGAPDNVTVILADSLPR
jgi:serine/threonine protein phosphatase PrpC